MEIIFSDPLPANGGLYCKGKDQASSSCTGVKCRQRLGPSTGLNDIKNILGDTPENTRTKEGNLQK